MKDSINQTQLAASAPAATAPAASARDTSRRDWLKHVALLTGAAATAVVATRAQAQDATMMAPNGTMMNNGMMIMGQNDSMTVMKPAPLGDQAVEGASVVPSTKLNPNNPALTIPRAAVDASASDADILNFALGLEYLEATFYASIVEAQNRRGYLSPDVARAAQVLANDEAAHVTAILDVLGRAGATPINKPSFQFPANVYVSQVAFLDLAATFEVTGVGAYLGAAPLVDGTDALRFAASIYGIEARHTGLIRMLAGLNPSPSALEVPLGVPEVQSRVAPFIIT